MINRAFEILTDSEYEYDIIKRDNGEQCVQFHAFEFEIDEDDGGAIYYDVKRDMWGTNARVDYNLYKNNLADFIKNLLNENGIDCKINRRLGRIRILNK